MSAIVQASDLRYVYPDGTELHFRGTELSLGQAERAALLGPNGSGKTTLLSLLLGLLKPVGGIVRVFGVDPVEHFERILPRIGVVLQNPDRQIIAPTVRDDIAFSPRNHGAPEREIERLVQGVAAQLEIEHLLDKVPHYLSGGEKTKVALAGALVMQPDLLVLDEPFEDLDTMAKEELITLLARLHLEMGTAVIASTHDIELVPKFADTVYLMATGGAVVARMAPRELFASPELLSAHHLEPPSLADLFRRLRERGIPVGTAVTVEEAADRLAHLVQGQREQRAA